MHWRMLCRLASCGLNNVMYCAFYLCYNLCVLILYAFEKKTIKISVTSFSS